MTECFWSCMAQKPIVQCIVSKLSLQEFLQLIGVCKRIRLLWRIELVCKKNKGRPKNNFHSRTAELTLARDWRHVLGWSEKLLVFGIKYDINMQNPLRMLNRIKQKKVFESTKKTTEKKLKHERTKDKRFQMELKQLVFDRQLEYLKRIKLK